MFPWLLSEAVCTLQGVRGWVKCKTWSAVFTLSRLGVAVVFLFIYIIVKNCSWVVVGFNCVEGIVVCCFCSTAPQRPAMPMLVSSNTGSVPPIKSLDSGLSQSPSASRSSLDTMGPLPSVPTPTAVDSIPSLSVGPADLASPTSQQQADVAVKQGTDGSLTESKPSVEMQRRPSITSPTAGNDVTTPSQPVVSGGVGEGPAPLTLLSPTIQLPSQLMVKTPTSATPSIKVVPNPNLKKGVRAMCMYACALNAEQ